MSGNTDIWEIDREFSIVLDNLLELEHEKLQNSILEKSVFGSVTPRRGDGEGASPSVVLAAAFTRESLPPGSEVLQKVMQDIRSHPYNSWTTPYGHSVPIQRHRKKFRKWIEVVWKSNKRFTSVLDIHLQTYVILQFEVVWQVVRLCSKLITCTMHGMKFRSRCCSNVDRKRISRTARFLLSSQMKVV